MKPSADKIEQAISDAQRAAQSGIRELLAEQESNILNRLISQFRTGDLSPEDAKIGIGVISEIRSLDAKTVRTINRGQSAAREL